MKQFILFQLFFNLLLYLLIFINLSFMIIQFIFVIFFSIILFLLYLKIYKDEEQTEQSQVDWSKMIHFYSSSVRADTSW